MSQKVVVITGATRGLGLCLAQKFIEQGALVYGCSRTEDHWASAREAVTNEDLFRLNKVSLTDEESVKSWIADIISQESKIDILINNAGYANGITRVEDLTQEDFQHHMDHNLLSCFLVCKHVLPFMQRQKSGQIINISSMAGKRSVPRLFAYSASKFGVVALSQSIAKENDDNGIKCYTVCPGGINTLMRAELFGEEDASKQQSPDYVAGVIMDTIEDKISVDSGGDIVIRHGEITAINQVPGR